MTSESDPIKLKDAAQHFNLTVSTLRAEAGRGRLTIYRIGKTDYTTPNDIKEMVRLCRVDPKARDFTLTRRGNIGSSGTDRSSSALAAANETVLRLRSTSRNTSAKSISQKSRARQ